MQMVHGYDKNSKVSTEIMEFGETLVSECQEQVSCRKAPSPAECTPTTHGHRKPAEVSFHLNRTQVIHVCQPCPSSKPRKCRLTTCRACMLEKEVTHIYGEGRHRIPAEHCSERLRGVREA